MEAKFLLQITLQVLNQRIEIYKCGFWSLRQILLCIKESIFDLHYHLELPFSIGHFHLEH